MDLFLYREPEAEEDKEEASKYDTQITEDNTDYSLAQTVSTPAAGAGWEGNADATWTGDWNDQAGGAGAGAAGAGAAAGATQGAAGGSWDPSATQSWDQ